MGALVPPPCSEIIIAADADDAGRKAAAQLADRLRYEGRKVSIAAPPVAGADWNDRLQAGLDDAALREEWHSALAGRTAEGDPILAREEEAFMSLAFAKREHLLNPWLPLPGLVMLHAPRGEGKTWFSLAVGKAVAGGQELLGWACPNYAKVLYVDGELPGAALQDRLSKFRRSPPGTFHVLCRDDFHLGRQQMPDLGDAAGRREFDRIIDQCAPDLIILNSLSTLVRSGIENEAESWTPVQDWLLSHRWQGRTILLVHHEGKTGRPRGTSKREDTLDTMIGLRKVTDDDNSDNNSDNNSVFQLTFTKSRDFYGVAAEPLLIRLTIKDGQVSWTHETVRDARADKIRELLKNGATHADIGKELGLTKSRVGQIAKEMASGPKVVKFKPRPRADDPREEG